MSAKAEPGGVKNPWADSPPELHPKQRIFLSIDAIGSTELKSSLANKGCTPDIWASGFMAFLPEVLVVYWRKYVEAVNRHCQRDNCATPCVPKDITRKAKSTSPYTEVTVWKYIGDEVVLVSELTCQKYHPLFHTLALAETVKHFNHEFEKNRPEPDNVLRFKGTAWVGGFPVTNIELNLPGQVEGQSARDFLGPSIDLGFRLSKFASEDRLVISASLAYLIANCSPMGTPLEHTGDNCLSLPMCFGGLIEAKGVKNGKHPLIWHSVKETEESKLCRVQNEQLLHFLKNSHFKDEEILPFILDPSQKDTKYNNKYKKAAVKQKKIPYSIFFFFAKRKTRAASTSSAKSANAAAADLDAEKIVRRLPPSSATGKR